LTGSFDRNVDRVGHSVVFVVAVAVQSGIRATTNATTRTPAGTLA